jgi:hypothetical protein
MGAFRRARRVGIIAQHLPAETSLVTHIRPAARAAALASLAPAVPCDGISPPLFGLVGAPRKPQTPSQTPLPGHGDLGGATRTPMTEPTGALDSTANAAEHGSRASVPHLHTGVHRAGSVRALLGPWVVHDR